jgi:hypothetical protein
MEDEAETPETFLTKLSDALAKEGVDAGLVEILRTHILTATPAKDAVAQAEVAIIKLAGERAAAPKAEAANG